MLATAPLDFEQQLVAPAFYADPYPLYHQLRAAAPVYWSAALGGWVLTRYEDVLASIRATQHFSSRGRMLAAVERFPESERAALKPLEDHFTVGLISADPPDHTRLRALVNKAFTPRVVEQLRPRIQALVDALLDAALAQPEFDIISDLAYPLPAIVIAELLGAPPAARDQFKVWSNGILSFQGRGVVTAAQLAHAQTQLVEMRAFLSDLLAQRRRKPQDDLVSRLVEAESVGDRLTEAELLTTCVTLLTAGHETTTNLIGNGVYTLLRHPDQLQRLRQEPALLPSAIEELLRFESPLQRNPRRVAADLVFGGQQLRQGDFVLQILGAANRDPAVFTEPDRFDIARQPNRHVAFGFGIHFCVGAPLARLEAPIAIATLLRRLPSLRLAGASAPTWYEHGLLRGLERLPVSGVA